MATIIKGLIGKQDIQFKADGTSVQTFTREDSSSRIHTLEQIDAAHLQFRSVVKQVDDLVDGGFDVPIKPQAAGASGSFIPLEDVANKYLHDLFDGGYDVAIKPSDIITKGPWFDVRAYGAIGDGVTDDTAAIQAAMDAAKVVGGTVFFPVGVYVCNSQLALSAPSGVTLQGVSASTQLTLGTIIKYTGTASPFIEISDTTPAASTRLKNINFQYTNGSFTGTLVKLYSAPVVVEDCNFTGNGVSTATLLLDPGDSVDFSIDRCSFNFAINAINGEGMNAGTVKDCLFNPGLTTSNILNPGDGWTIQGCGFELLSDGTGKAIKMDSGKSSKGMKISGNWFGDATDNSAWNWVDVRGSGWQISGNYFNGEGNLASTAIKVLSTSNGLFIAGNRFASFATGVDLGTNVSGDVTILGNFFTTVTTWVDVSGGLVNKALIQGSASTVSLSVYRSGALVLQIPETGNIIIDSGLTVGALTASNGLALTGSFTKSISTLENDATPSVLDGGVLLTGGTTTITDFDSGVEGQIITIIAEHTITITDGTNIFLNGSANFVMAATDTLTLIQKADGKWYETARSDNT